MITLNPLWHVSICNVIQSDGLMITHNVLLTLQLGSNQSVKYLDQFSSTQKPYPNFTNISIKVVGVSKEVSNYFINPQEQNFKLNKHVQLFCQSMSCMTNYSKAKKVDWKKKQKKTLNKQTNKHTRLYKP